MPKKKKLKYSHSRLKNIRGWLRKPVFAVAVFLIVFFAVSAIFLSFPCGKRGPLVPEHGFCDSVPILSGLQVGVIAASFGLVCLLFLMMQEAPPDKGTLRKIFSRSAKPKWWRRWYSATFVFCYLLLATAIYWLDIGSGLRWYHYAAQYMMLAPLLSSFLASLLLTGWRKIRHLPILR